jgi:hypothetical protein
MLVETIARKPLTIGAVRLNPGDVVSDDVEALLPPGRMKVLKDQGWLAERPIGQDTDELAARLAVLEEKVAQFEARRGPGRPRKIEEE